MRRLVLLLVFGSSLCSAQTITALADSGAVSDTLFLRVVIPGEDTVRVDTPRYRVGASTSPSARAFIGDKEVTVYPTGAFVGLVPLPVGESTLRLLVRDAAGDSLWRDFVFIRSEPLKTSSRDTLTIDEDMMEPAQDLWLREGDVLEVRFKGSPGYEASFSIDGVESGIPMMELPASETRGIEGIYVGRYVMKEDDETTDGAVEFTLRKSFWSSEDATAKGSVTIIPSGLPRVGLIQGERPYLNVGLGGDRLGGAKMGYIEPGVLVEIIGQQGRQYRVRLCESLDGWIPRRFVQLLPVATPLPRSLTGSISVEGYQSVDVVTVGLQKRLPYATDQTVGPATITVDVFGATSNTNWITHQLSAEGIKSVSWDQVGSDHYRLSIVLNSEQHWGYEIGYNAGSNLRIVIRRPPVIASPDSVLYGMLIAVDAGHGGESLGALGATGVQEKDMTLSMASLLDSVFTARGAAVVMVRANDTAISMSDRAQKIIDSRARLLVSIHCNSIGFTSDPEEVSGTATFYRYIGHQRLAETVFHKMIELDLNQFGVVGSFNFSLNALTQLPNVLVETAFLSNPTEEMKLLDISFRRAIAVKIADGVEEYLRMYGKKPAAVPAAP